MVKPAASKPADGEKRPSTERRPGGPGGAGGGGEGGGGRSFSRRTLLLLAAAVVLVAGTAVAVVTVRSGNQASLTSIRPSGIPANISTPDAALMGLDSLPTHRAPGFTLTDQSGQTLSLDSFRGRPVILEFMDPHCTDICPILSQEFVDAYHDLGSAGHRAVFLAVNVNKYALGVSAIAAFSKAHQLDTIPTWHFFTGPLPTLEQLWTKYEIAVTAPGPNADVLHTSIVYFIGPNGHERYLAAPAVTHTKTGQAFLPTNQITAWGHGIATLARDLGA
ncbi:MAG: SCO family protein [Acidimicrobiales bacterium]